MDTKQRNTWISLIILLFCILLAAVIYIYTGNVVIAIFLAPPIIHWILEKRRKSRQG